MMQLRRILVVLVTLAALWVVAGVPLPGIDRELLAEWAGPSFFTNPAFSVGALGVTPWVTAAVVAELAAMAWGPWRVLRVSGPEARAPIERLTAVLWVLFACIQAYAMALASEQMRLGFVPLVSEPGTLFRLVFVASLVAGSAVCVALCRWCARDGLGVGLLAAVVLQHTEEAQMWAAWVQLGEGVVLAPVLVVVAGLALVGLRPPGKTTSTSVAGLVPIGTLVAVPALVGFEPVPLVALALVLTGGLAFLFQMPERVARVRGVDAQLVRSDLGLGIAVNAAVVVGLVIFALQGNTPAWGLGLVVLGVAAWDVAEEMRARGDGTTVEVWQLHRVYAVDPAVEALRAAGIPANARGVRVRSLFHALGPYFPIGILVEPGREDEARGVLRAWQRASVAE